MNEYDIIIRPYITEKSTDQIAEGKYTFVVDIRATKIDIKRAIEKLFDVKLIQKLCPYADDLWLTFMAYRNNTKITAETPWRSFPITIYGTAEGSLWYVNAAEGQNDEQWRAMLEYFNGSMK